MHETQELQFDIHLANGRAFSFEQNDAPAITQALQQLQPDRVFTEEQLMVAGKTHITTLPTRSVCYLHLQFDVAPQWNFGGNIHDVQQVEATDFAQVVSEQIDRERPPTESFEAFVELSFVDGTCLYLHVSGDTMPMAIQSKQALRVLQQPSLMARSLDGGFLIINPRNIVSLASYPGSAEVPPSAIHARFKKA